MKLVFIHAGLRVYRNKIFTRLSKNYDIKLLIYGGKVVYNSENEWIKESPNWDYKIVSSFPFLGYSFFAPSLIYKPIKYDIIISSDPSSFATHISFLIAKLFRKKFILWAETWIWPNHFMAKLAFPYVKFIIKHSDACIAAGTKAKEFFVKCGAKKEKVFIAPNCALDKKNKINQTAVEKIRTNQNLQGKKVILYLGRIIKVKGLDYLIKSFARLEKEIDNIVLLIGGTGDFKDYCKRLAKKLDVKNCIFLGQIPHQEVANYFELCDVFVLPSRFMIQNTEPAEAWGLTINEVMSIGKPIISTNAVGSAYDLIENGKNGYMVKERDVDELYRKLKNIVTDEKLIISMGKRSKEIISKRFNYNLMFEAFRNAIEYVKKN